MREFNYPKLGRKLLRENPELAYTWQQELEQLETEAETDITRIESLFVSFCQIKGISIPSLRENESRSTVKNVTHCRDFIAIIKTMYDGLQIAGYEGRGSTGVRQALCDTLNRNECWISQVWESISNDLLHLTGYRAETDRMITLLQQSSPQHTTPQFFNEKRRLARQMSIEFYAVD